MICKRAAFSETRATDNAGQWAKFRIVTFAVTNRFADTPLNSNNVHHAHQFTFFRKKNSGKERNAKENGTKNLQ